MGKNGRSDERSRLLEELSNRYEGSRLLRRFAYVRKKYLWLLVVGGAKLVKRLIDVVISALVLLLLFPLMLIVSLVIKLDDRGPVFHVATRVGKWGKEFPFPKFRTMLVNAERMGQEARKVYNGDPDLKMKQDPRVTRVGMFLRTTSIDELPQLWCVLIGDMSLVGPRPPLVHEVERYTAEQRRRLDVTPGLTGLWQVSGRSDLSFKEQIALDLQYIESQSLRLDLKILLKTIPVVLSGKGAY